jgi:hypothetical protein
MCLPTARSRAALHGDAQLMKRVTQTGYRCGLCHEPADADTTNRARTAWQPLIICERCLREADARWSGDRLAAAGAAAA